MNPSAVTRALLWKEVPIGRIDLSPAYGLDFTSLPVATYRQFEQQNHQTIGEYGDWRGNAAA